MRKNKQLLSLVLAMMILAIFVAPPVQASNINTRVTFMGNALRFDVQPRVINGRTFVQYRPIAEASEATVNWEPANNRVTVMAGNSSVIMTIGSRVATVNGRRTNIEAAPILAEGHVMVPLRFVAETLGYETTWRNGVVNMHRRTFVLREREGNRLLFDTAPRRIISLSVCITSILHGLGITPVGMNRTGAPLPPGLRDVPEVGMHNNPSIERILSLHPDVVIAPTRTRATLTPIFARHNIRVLFLDSMSLQETMDNVKMFGVAFDLETQANRIIEDMETRRDRVLASIRGQQSPKVMAMIGSSEAFSFATEVSFVGSLLKLLNARNVAEEVRLAERMPGSIPFSVERAVALNPDVILKVAHAGNRAEAERVLLNEFRNNPVWQSVSAVRQNKVHMLDSSLVTHIPLGLSAIDALEHVARILYPQVNFR